MPKENVDEYLEAILDLSKDGKPVKTGDLAARLNVAPASATEALQRMCREGLVLYEAYKGASLTKAGLARAMSVKRKHRLLEVFLTRKLGLRGRKVHDEACRMEHSLSDDVEAALCKMLGAPTECPDGEPIPSCGMDAKACGACMAGAVPLTSLKPGQKAKIAHIHGGKQVCNKLMEMGLTPGAEVSLVRAAPMHGPAEVLVRGSCLAIGAGIAAKIFVRPGA
ncbi:MAG: metal-dependent transcriptional regulator [Methanobacteriota archaeon]